MMALTREDLIDFLRNGEVVANDQEDDKIARQATLMFRHVLDHLEEYPEVKKVLEEEIEKVLINEE